MTTALSRRGAAVDLVVASPPAILRSAVAVVLAYDPAQHAAPVVVARGRGAEADALRAWAHRERVVVVEERRLGRRLYSACSVGGIVGEEDWVQVASVIAYARAHGSRASTAVPARPTEALVAPDPADFDEEIGS